MLRGGFSRDGRGVTLIEVVLVVAIMAVLAALSFSALRMLNATRALEGEAARVAAELQKARSLTISSKNNAQFGVHIQSSQVTLFQGTTFVVGSSTNSVLGINPLITISAISLAGGGSDVIFQRLTGKTAYGGTLTLSRRGSSAIKTITIYATGLVEVH